MSQFLSLYLIKILTQRKTTQSIGVKGGRRSEIGVTYDFHCVTNKSPIYLPSEYPRRIEPVVQNPHAILMRSLCDLKA